MGIDIQVRVILKCMHLSAPMEECKQVTIGGNLYLSFSYSMLKVK